MRVVGYWVLALGVAVMVGSFLTDRAVTGGLGIFTLGLVLIALGRGPRNRERRQRTQE